MKKYLNILYNRDESGLIGNAENIFFPKNTEEVREIIQKFSDIVPRGGGNNIVGGCVPNNSVVVDMKKMNNVVFKDGFIFVESGITVKELNEKLKTIRREFPIFLDDSSTIGGIIAMNDFGYFGGYGNIKEWIEEIEFVNGNGEIINAKKTDFSDVCGLEGITGIITKAKIKTISINNKSFSIFQTDSCEEVIAIAKKLRSDEEVIMLRLYSPYLSRMLALPERHHVIIGFNSDRGKIKGEECIKIFDIIKKENYFLRSEGYYDSEDSQFLFDRLWEFISFLDNLKIPYFGDLHLGIIQSFFKGGFKKEIVKAIQRMNGKPAKYGIGIKRKELLDNLQKRILRRVKSRHDPLNKINRGKVIDFVSIEKEEIEEAFIENKIEKTGIQDIIVDYENAYKSELYGEKKEKIEDFAKNVAGELVKSQEIDKDELINTKIQLILPSKQNSQNINNDLKTGSVFVRDNLDRKSPSSEEMDLINKIMFNKKEKKKT